MARDTIAAIATPPGRGGVGIVRISGPAAALIAQHLLGSVPKPRYAYYGNFYSDASQAEVLDQGIALYFPGPNSFTGEDVVELQGHGGPVILDCLLKAVLACGARLAQPGEFSERAFLNDKIDLTQAEAIADLIDSASEEAARSAMRSLQGVFRQNIESLVEAVIALRIYVEAAIDFPEEEIDFLSDGHVASGLRQLIEQLDTLRAEARQGALLREGMNVVIAGRPNAGKSSLLNALAGRESAIVTDIAGTTRDVLREQISIDGMPLHIIDTAGLREATDEVERIGIERAYSSMETADLLLLVVDASAGESSNDPAELLPEVMSRLPQRLPVTVVHNKCDLSGQPSALTETAAGRTVLRLSAKQGDGLELLREHLKTVMGFRGSDSGGFIARRRHLESLEQAAEALANGQHQLTTLGAGELLAEDLRECQNALSEITGSFTSDDLLGRIFSSFCIGK